MNNYVKGLVSIIIPSYNYSKYVCEAIDSCLNQTYKKFEIIVVDDGSTDDTRDALDKYLKSNQIIYIYQDNKGLAGARNTGLKHANGEFIQYLDADDLLEPTKLEKQVHFLNSNDGIFGVCCRTGHFTGNLDNFLVSKIRVHTGNVASKLIKGNFISVLSMLTRRSEILFDEGLRACEDWDYWLRVSISGKKFAYLNEFLCFVRFHYSNMSKNENSMFYWDMVVLDKLESNSEYLSEIKFEKFKRCYLKGNKESTKYLSEAINIEKKIVLKLVVFLVLTFLRKIKKCLKKMISRKN